MKTLALKYRLFLLCLLVISCFAMTTQKAKAIVDPSFCAEERKGCLAEARADYEYCLSAPPGGNQNIYNPTGETDPATCHSAYIAYISDCNAQYGSCLHYGDGPCSGAFCR